MTAEFHYPDCIHCGLCLSACPTYLVAGLESESPRGRLLLIDNIRRNDNSGALDISESTGIAFSHLDTCLDCRACATACPSGVNYPSLLDSARMLQEKVCRSEFKQQLKKLLLSLILHPGLMSILQFFGWVFQKSGILFVLGFLFPSFRSMPKLRPRAFPVNRQKVYPAMGTKKGIVAFFTGCVMNNLYPQVHEATIRLLRWNGYEVHIPVNQTCCGALHHHNGVRESISGFKDRNIYAFEKYDVIIVNSAGCGAELKDYPDPQFTKKVQDITEFFESKKLRPVSASKEFQSLKIIWDAPCHLVHGQKIENAPYRILRHFGLNVIDFPQSNICCGSAGSYMVTQPEMAEAVLHMKIIDIERTGCDVVITANPGCQMHIQRGLKQFSKNKQVKHICELLDDFYKSDPEYRKI